MNFQEWLNKALEERGISRRELATRVGVDHASVMAWTRGRTPSWENAGQIADALGGDRAYVRALAGYTDDPTPEPPSDPGLQEVVAIWRALDDQHRESALLTLALKQVMEEAGLPVIHFHDLRHSTATLLLTLGVDVRTVQIILGHTSVRTTEVYAHVLPELTREAMARLDALLRRDA